MNVRLRFPDELAVTPCKVIINQDGISEEGEPLTSIIWNGKCIFSNKAKRILTSEQKSITLEGTIIVKGDMAPDLSITSGIVEINNRKMSIYRSQRPNNPDGTVFSTELQVY